MRFEHINQAPEVEEILRFFFSEVEIVRYPIQNFNGSIYSYFEVRTPNHTDCCLPYLEESLGVIPEFEAPW